LTFSVNAGPPTAAVDGLRLVVAGTGLLMVKVCELEVPPPGAALYTVTCAVPAVAVSTAVISAVKRVAETYVVVRFDPFQRTTEPLTKPLPLTVRVNAAPPAVADVGVKLLITGNDPPIILGR
jgi:hypothetical protein